MEATAGFEPAIKVLQTFALPLGHAASISARSLAPGSPRSTSMRLEKSRESARTHGRKESINERNASCGGNSSNIAVEAATGIEPAYKSLAGLCLPFWRRRLNKGILSGCAPGIRKKRGGFSTDPPLQEYHQQGIYCGSNSYSERRAHFAASRSFAL